MIFARKDYLVVGDYLSGDYSWPYAVTLQSMLINAAPPTGGAKVAIALEIGGLLTENGITLQSTGNASDTFSADLGIVVPANTSVRFKVVGAPTDDSLSASQVFITVSKDITGAIPAQPLTVVWADGQSIIPLYAYNPTTHAFTDISNGQSATLATIMESSPFSDFGIYFQNSGSPVLALEIIGGSLNVFNSTIQGGSYSPISPQVQFRLGTQILAAVLSDGTLIAPQMSSGAVADGANQFTIFSDDIVTATISPSGVTALQFGSL